MPRIKGRGQGRSFHQAAQHKNTNGLPVVPVDDDERARADLPRSVLLLDLALLEGGGRLRTHSQVAAASCTTLLCCTLEFLDWFFLSVGSGGGQAERYQQFDIGADPNSKKSVQYALCCAVFSFRTSNPLGRGPPRSNLPLESSDRMSRSSHPIASKFTKCIAVALCMFPK